MRDPETLLRTLRSLGYLESELPMLSFPELRRQAGSTTATLIQKPVVVLTRQEVERRMERSVKSA